MTKVYTIDNRLYLKTIEVSTIRHLKLLLEIYLYVFTCMIPYGWQKMKMI